MRREVLKEVRQLKAILEHHRQEGLPEADLQVIRRGKALEYYSRHYGKVFVDEGQPMSVKDALVGINQLLDEAAGTHGDPPPANAEPWTRQFLRLFDKIDALPRDQMQKFLRGTGTTPDDFTGRGWCKEEKKVYHLTSAPAMAAAWHGKQRKGMVHDYDQAMFFIGACFEDSGINVNETLNNPNFRPHPALGGILHWFVSHGADWNTRQAALRAEKLVKAWEDRNAPIVQSQLMFREDDGEAA